MHEDVIRESVGRILSVGTKSGNSIWVDRYDQQLANHNETDSLVLVALDKYDKNSVCIIPLSVIEFIQVDTSDL